MYVCSVRGTTRAKGKSGWRREDERDQWFDWSRGGDRPNVVDLYRLARLRKVTKTSTGRFRATDDLIRIIQLN